MAVLMSMQSSAITVDSGPTVSGELADIPTDRQRSQLAELLIVEV